MISFRRGAVAALAAFCMAGILASAASIQPIRLREVRLGDLPRQQGERISALTIQVTAACVSGITVPLDWRVEVGFPEPHDGTFVEAEAGHGTAYLGAGDPGVVLTLASYKEWGGHEQFSAEKDLKVWATLVSADGENTRTNQIPATCILVKEIPVAAPSPEQ